MKVFLKVLSAIALLAWTAAFVLGFNYRFDSIPVACLLGIFLAALVVLVIYFLMRWSNPSLNDNVAKAKNREIACISAYALLFALTVTDVAHFVTVQTDVKAQIKPVAEKRIAELERIFSSDPETEGSYLNYVEQKSVLYRTELKGVYYDNSHTLDVKCQAFKDDLMGDGRFAELQYDVEALLGKCRYSVYYWVPWTISGYLDRLDSDLESWESEVVELSMKHIWIREKNEPFVPNSLADGSRLADEIRNPSMSRFGVLTILLVVVLQFFILLPYIAGRNWSASGPKRYKGHGVASWDRNAVNLGQNQGSWSQKGRNDNGKDDNSAMRL